MADTPNSPQIPEYLKRYVMPIEQVASSDAESMASASLSVPRVSLKAKKFRYIENGEEIKAETETHFVILSVEPGPGKMCKTFYAQGYNPGDTSPPTCSSSDGIRPDSWVSAPQNDLCATCKNNAFGSATSLKGKPSKACRDSKRLWITPPDALTETVYGLQVPVTSLKSLSELGTKIKDTGLPLSTAVIKATMMEDESFPILVFDIAGWLHEKFVDVAVERSKKKDWQGALKSPNPPVSGALVDRTKAEAGADPVGIHAPSAPAGAIEGKAETVAPKAAPNVDEVLKTWG
jgi:hypothetical protein